MPSAPACRWKPSRRALGEQQRDVVGARGQPRPGETARREHRDQLHPAQQEVGGQHARGPDGEAVERGQRVGGVPDAAETRAEAGVVLSRRPVDEAPGDRLCGPAAAGGVEAGSRTVGWWPGDGDRLELAAAPQTHETCVGRGGRRLKALTAPRGERRLAEPRAARRSAGESRRRSAGQPCGDRPANPRGVRRSAGWSGPAIGGLIRAALGRLIRAAGGEVEAHVVDGRLGQPSSTASTNASRRSAGMRSRCEPSATVRGTRAGPRAPRGRRATTSRVDEAEPFEPGRRSRRRLRSSTGRASPPARGRRPRRSPPASDGDVAAPPHWATSRPPGRAPRAAARTAGRGRRSSGTSRSRGSRRPGSASSSSSRSATSTSTRGAEPLARLLDHRRRAVDRHDLAARQPLDSAAVTRPVPQPASSTRSSPRSSSRSSTSRPIASSGAETRW